MSIPTSIPTANIRTTTDVEPQPSSPEAGDPTARILIVDDNADIVTVIRRILTTRGYETLSAGSGREALDLARRERPDVILLDWMIPEMDGLEVCRALKGDPETRGIMILLVTGRGSVANRVEGFNAGADDYIPKPFNHPELLARIRSALRLKRLADDLEKRNRQLIESQNELVRAEKMATIGLLASGIAHEFNNIMAGIAGYAQLARSNAKYAPQLIDVALTQTERALELTKSLSTYNRRAPDPADCDVPTVISSTLWLVKKEIEHHGIELRTRIDDVPRAAIRPGQLQEVILNLIINAIHAIGSKGTISLSAVHTPGTRELQISVEDTGEGIPEANIDKIFDPFFTTKGALGGGSHSGTGLGLSVCYNVVQSVGGRIDVESQEGSGARFTVTLPTFSAEESAAAPAASRDSLAGKLGCAGTAAASLRVLVVDDEEPVRAMLQEFLKDHRVTCCASGEQAIEEYRRQPYDFVILDICMADSMNGIETLEALGEIDPEVRAILASGRLPREIDPDALDRAYGHLLKPYKLEELASLLGI